MASISITEEQGTSGDGDQGSARLDVGTIERDAVVSALWQTVAAGEEAWFQSPAQTPPTAHNGINEGPHVQWSAKEGMAEPGSIQSIQDSLKLPLHASQRQSAMALDAATLILPTSLERDMWEDERGEDPMWQEASSTQRVQLAHIASAQHLPPGPDCVAQQVTEHIEPTQYCPHLQQMDTSQLTVSEEHQQMTARDNQMDQAAFMTAITKPLTPTTMALTPAPCLGRKKGEDRNSLRRSRRIALAGNTRPSIELVQCVLMRKLGILSE